MAVHPSGGDTVTGQAGKEAVLAFLHATAVLADTEAAMQLVADGYRDHAFEAEGAEAVRRFQRSAAGASSTLGDPVFAISDGDLISTLHHLPQPSPDSPATAFDFFWPNTFRVADGKLIEAWPGINRIAPLEASPDGAATEPAVEVVDAPRAAVESNKRLVLEFYRRVFDGHDAAAVGDFVNEDYRQHTGDIPQGRSGLEGFVGQLFPDGPIEPPESLSNPPVHLVAEGDIVVIVPCLPQPVPDAPARTYPFYLHDSFRIRDGKLADHWSGVNRLAPPVH